MIEKAHDHKPAVFEDFILSFNKETLELGFYDINTNTWKFKSNMITIYNNRSLKRNKLP